MDRTISDEDVAHGEWVEKELDHFVSRRDRQRQKEEGERPAEEAWRASERRQEALRREENRLAWSEYHRAAAARHKANMEALIRHHEQQAERIVHEN